MGDFDGRGGDDDTKRDVTVIVAKRTLLVENLWLSLLTKVKQAMLRVVEPGTDEDNECLYNYCLSFR